MSFSSRLAQALLDGDPGSARDFLKKMNVGKLKPGESISHGTLNDEHLVDRFMEVLKHMRPELYHKLADGNADYEAFSSRDDFTPIDWDWLSYFLNEQVFPAMQSLCPPGTYFGSHPGDGSDFGCWPVEDDDL